MLKSIITKSCGVSAYEVFQILLLLALQGKNLFCFLNSKHKDQAVSKNTYYRFLNETSYNRSRFIMLLDVKIKSAFDSLTRPKRVKVLISDDSVFKLNRINTNVRKGLSFLLFLTDTSVFQLDLTCFLRLIKAIVAMKY